MAGPMYFFPGFGGSAFTDAQIKAKLIECELDSILGDLDSSHRNEQSIGNNGPDGGSGLIISAKVDPPATNPNTGYYPDDQTWVHIKPKGYWIGTQNSSKPIAVDLQRNGHLLQDYSIKLADGNDWAIMTIRPLLRQGSMPRVGRMNDDCEWEWSAHPKYQELTKKYEIVFAGSEETISGWADIAIETLAVNYRINKYLAMILELLQADDCGKIIDLGCDLPELLAHQEAKKRGVERSEVYVTSYGEITPLATPVISQPTSTSI